LPEIVAVFGKSLKLEGLGRVLMHVLDSRIKIATPDNLAHCVPPFFLA
jgi:hypothetical protein